MKVMTDRVNDQIIQMSYVIRGSYGDLANKNTIFGEKDHDMVVVYYFDESNGNIKRIENQDIFLLGEEMIENCGIEMNLKNFSDIILNLMVVKYEVNYISSLFEKRELIKKDLNNQKIKNDYIEIKNYILNYIYDKGNKVI